MNRRNFFKGLCALAVAPLAAALSMTKPRPQDPTLADNEFVTASTIRKIEAQLSGDLARPYDSNYICVYRIDYVDAEGNIIPQDIVEAARIDLAERAELTHKMMYQNFEDGCP